MNWSTYKDSKIQASVALKYFHSTMELGGTSLCRALSMPWCERSHFSEISTVLRSLCYVMPFQDMRLLSHRSSRPLPCSWGLEPSIPVPCLPRPWQPSQPMAPTQWAWVLPEALPTPGCILPEWHYWDNWHLQNWSKEPEISSLESPGLILTLKALNRPTSCMSVPLSCRPKEETMSCLHKQESFFFISKQCFQLTSWKLEPPAKKSMKPWVLPQAHLLLLSSVHCRQANLHLMPLCYGD